jgi:hypothetical protein
MRNSKGAHPAIAFFVFSLACAMTFGEVSAQVATFMTQQYPLRLRIKATSTRSNATLQAFVTSNNQLIGTLSNQGGGRFGGEFSWPTNPQSVTVRSNFGGQATRTVTAR